MTHAMTRNDANVVSSSDRHGRHVRRRPTPPPTPQAARDQDPEKTRGGPSSTAASLRSATSDESGGAKGDRTPDLRIANAALSQLSYCPNSSFRAADSTRREKEVKRGSSSIRSIVDFLDRSELDVARLSCERGRWRRRPALFAVAGIRIRGLRAPTGRARARAARRAEGFVQLVAAGGEQKRRRHQDDGDQGSERVRSHARLSVTRDERLSQ